MEPGSWDHATLLDGWLFCRCVTNSAQFAADLWRAYHAPYTRPYVFSLSCRRQDRFPPANTNPHAHLAPPPPPPQTYPGQICPSTSPCSSMTSLPPKPTVRHSSSRSSYNAFKAESLPNPSHP
ncbi:hypothetical protein M405DRAFT_526439 [Rhizopogon salebrosus TDB-379]|nr:hypothetical protein M405DRAFT_526439 [Rhizopogon salebrosus TDB-379]